MSIRGYRINKIDHEKRESFNLWHDKEWHDKELLEFLERECSFCEHLDESGGIGEVPVKVLERAIKELELEEHIVSKLKEDIEWAKERDGGSRKSRCGRYAYGIESYYLKSEANMGILLLRANANRQRHAVLYCAKVDEDTDLEIRRLMNEGNYIRALSLLKEKCLELSFPEQFVEQYQKSWKLIPNPELD